MKKTLFTLLLLIAATMSFTSAFAAGIDECGMNEVKLQIDNPMMNACGIIKEVDVGRGTTPIIDSGYTLVPIRAVIEAFDGEVGWDDEARSVYVSVRDKSAIVTIDSTEAIVYTPNKEETVTLAVAPRIINGRTMLPLRFVSESVGLEVDWNDDEKVITVTQPKSEPVTFANVEGEFYPIGDLIDVRIGGKDMTVYNYGGDGHQVKTEIISTEQIEWDENTVFDFYDPETSLSSITVDGTQYSIANVFNLEYVGVADLVKGVKGFEIIVVDRGVSDDYMVSIYTYDMQELISIGTYMGMTYDYYANGTGTVYCDGNGNIINEYIGFTQPMYAQRIDTVKGDNYGRLIEIGVNVLDPDVAGKSMVFGRDLFAYYIEVDYYPEDFGDIWSIYTSESLKTVEKGTPVVIDDIKYGYYEETGERYLLGYYVTIDDQKNVIQLQYAG